MTHQDASNRFPFALLCFLEQNALQAVIGNQFLDEPRIFALRGLSNRERALFIMAHFDHPRELTPEARDGIATMLDSNARMINQCRLIKGTELDNPLEFAVRKPRRLCIRP